MPQPEDTKMTPMDGSVSQGLAHRPIARMVLILTLLILGAVAAVRLELDYLPARSFPELRVRLHLPRGLDPDSMSRKYLLPLESAIRAAGGVRAVGGEVDPLGVYFRVLLEAGIDSESKAARMESELAALRRSLPTGSRLQIWPWVRGANDESVVLWFGVGNEEIDPNWLAAVRALPEVRSVTVAGNGTQEIQIEPEDPRATAGELRQAFERYRRIEDLGEITVGDRRLPLLIPSGNSGLAALDIERDGLWLVDAARLSLAQAEAPWQARVDGEEGRAVWLEREPRFSPMELRGALKTSLERFELSDKVRFLVDEAEPLAELLRRLGLAIALVSLLAASLGAWFYGRHAAFALLLSLPLSLAAMLNALWLFDLPLDVTTLPILLAALAVSLLGQALRRPGSLPVPAFDASMSSALPWVGIALAAGALTPALTPSAKTFTAGVIAGTWVLFLLPQLPRPRARRQPRRLWRTILRNPMAVVLAGATLTYASLLLSGSALSPQAGSLAPTQGDLVAQLQFSEGTTLSEAADRIDLVEAEFGERPEIESWWCTFDRRQALLMATVREEHRYKSRLRSLATRLQLRLSAVAAASHVFPLGEGRDRQGRRVQLTEDLQDRAETDPDAVFYTYILRSTELDALRAAHQTTIDRLNQLVRNRHRFQSDWGAPSLRLEVGPRPEADRAEAEEALKLIRRRAFRGNAIQLDATRHVDLRLVDPSEPRSDNEVKQRSDLLAAGWSADQTPISPAEVLNWRGVLSSPRVKRQAGRFVLPVTISLPGMVKGRRAIARSEYHRILHTLNLPAGVELELPHLDPAYWTRERIRLLAISLTFPVLLLAWGICHLNSVLGGILAILSLLSGVAATTPVVHLTTGQVDELSLMMMATVLSGTMVVTNAVAIALGRGVDAPPIRTSYRWLIDRGPWLLGGASLGALLLVLPGLGLSWERHPWVLPMRIGGLTFLASCLAACFLLPAALRLAQSLREHRRRYPSLLSSWQRRARSWWQRLTNRTTPAAETENIEPEHPAKPRAWQLPGRVELAARRLTKVYGNGFCALRAVDFELSPGIIGLLGPNGAGKTTLLRLLCGLLESSRGKISYRGVPITPDNLPEYRRLVGFLPQDFNAYPGFTVERFLNYWAIERNLTDTRERRQEITRVLEQVDLTEFSKRKVRDLSGGQRRRIGIARALLGSPPILIVDEPTTGLDVESRNRLRESLLSVASERIVIFSTHIASDIAATASRILLLHGGQLLFDGPAVELIEKAHGRIFEAVLQDEDLRDFQRRFRVTARVRTLEGIRVRAVAPAGVEPAGRLIEPQLEEAYLTMLGELSSPREEREEVRRRAWVDLEAWR